MASNDELERLRVGNDVALKPVLARNFLASTWYETSGMSRKEKLYAKCRELVIGDRAECLVATGDMKPFDHRMRSNYARQQ